MVGSIDGTDEVPHDRAILKALFSSFHTPKLLYNCDPKAVVFVGRLPLFVDKNLIEKALKDLLNSRSHKVSHSRTKRRRSRSRSPFSDQKHGKWPKVHLVHDIVTGYQCGYGFAYFEDSSDAELVLRNWFHERHTFRSDDHRQGEPRGLNMPDGDKVILEPAYGGTLSGWRPRRLGGGLGGRKEAGQLRFGGVSRPFKRPFSV